MLIHRGNTLKAHQHIIFCICSCNSPEHCSIQRDDLKKNYTKSDQNIHQDVSNCTFFQKFLVA